MATLSNIDKYAYNPNLIQKDILELIDSNVTEISDPTSPFLTLLEAAAVSTVNNLTEYRSLLRKTYPYLATTKEELYRHIHNSNFGNICATPSDVEFTFMLPLNNITQYGYQDTTNNIYSTKIPQGTIILVAGIPFTIFNPINISVYTYDSVTNNTVKNIVVTEELNPSNLTIAYDRAGIIKHSTIVYKNQIYIKFTARVKQVITESKLYTTPVNGSVIVTSTIPANHQYYHSDIYHRTTTSSTWIELEKSLTDEFLSIDEPRCIITMADTVIGYTIPELYIANNIIGTQYLFNTYYTMGELNIPLYNVESKDYTIKYNNTSESKEASTITKMSLLVYSDGIVNGGTNEKSFSNIKQAVIDNILGNNATPITEKELIQAGSDKGYSIKKIEDNLLSREYIASKDIDNPVVDYVYAAENLYVNTLKFNQNTISVTHSNVVTLKTTDTETIIIKPNNVLRYDNGYLTLLNDIEIKELDNNVSTLTKLDDLNTLLRENMYFVNPYHYVINYTNKGVVTSNAYYISEPSITNNVLIGYNTSISPNVSINNSKIYYRSSGYYEIIFDVVYNDAYNSIPAKNKGYIARIKLSTGQYVYYRLGFSSDLDDGKLTATTYSLKIHTNFDLTSDGTLGVVTKSEYNGSTNASSPRLTLEPEVELYGCVLTSTDYSTYDNIKTSWDDELYTLYTGMHNYTIISKNKMELHLGDELAYLYRRSYTTYEDREYEVHEEDVYRTYTEAQYKYDENDMLKVTWSDGSQGWKTGSYKYDKDSLPMFDIRTDVSVGDVIITDEGNKVLVHAKGDIKLDENNNPIVKSNGSLIRYLDVMITDYLFYISSNKYYQNYDIIFKRNILDYVIDDMPALNEELLENTIVYYKPNKSIGTVSYKYGNGMSHQTARVSPTITLYSDDTTYINSNSTTIIARIGNIITDIFKQDSFTLEEVRTKIKEDLGDMVVAVKVNNITSDDAEHINLTNTKNRFILGTIASTDTNKNIIATYDINLVTVNTAI